MVDLIGDTIDLRKTGVRKRQIPKVVVSHHKRRILVTLTSTTLPKIMYFIKIFTSSDKRSLVIFGHIIFLFLFLLCTI